MRRNGSNRWNELETGGQFAEYAIHSGLLTSLLAGPGLLWDLDRRLLGGASLSPKTQACPGTHVGPHGKRSRPPEAKPFRPTRTQGPGGRRRGDKEKAQ